MTNLIIADLHLEEGRPEITALFFKFLKEEACQAQALYILGDLFEAWIGDDDTCPFNQSVIQALAKLSKQGTRLYFMPGNRDFLIGKHFLSQSGCELLPDEYLAQFGEHQTLLMHGDTLCTQDVKYLKFRKRARNFFIQKFFLFKSLEKRRALAAKARSLSAAHTQNTAAYIMDVTQEEVERVLRKHHTSRLIHGHTIGRRFIILF